MLVDIISWQVTRYMSGPQWECHATVVWLDSHTQNVSTVITFSIYLMRCWLHAIGGQMPSNDYGPMHTQTTPILTSNVWMLLVGHFVCEIHCHVFSIGIKLQANLIINSNENQRKNERKHNIRNVFCHFVRVFPFVRIIVCVCVCMTCKEIPQTINLPFMRRKIHTSLNKHK